MRSSGDTPVRSACWKLFITAITSLLCFMYIVYTIDFHITMINAACIKPPLKRANVNRGLTLPAS